jgi:hypothetical protein
MAINRLINIELSGLPELQHAIDATVFPRINQSIRQLLDMAHQEWAERALKAPKVWQGDKDRYVKSIDQKMTGDFAGEVWTDLPLAEDIERGRRERDLKRMLDTSTKVRISKKGKRYLIIPMRHNTSGFSAHAKAMPASVHVKALAMKKSQVTGTFKRPTGQGFKGGTFLSSQKTKSAYLVTGHKYQWGGRLPAGNAPKSKPHHATDIYAGMVRMNTSSGKQNSSAYMTFRVMSEDQSDKWIIPAQPPQEIAGAVERHLRAMAEPVLQAAMAADVAAL